MKTNTKVSIIAAAVVAMAMPLTGMAGEKKSNHYMKMVDTNGDGQVSAQEHAAAAAKRFAKMDANGDGMVTKEEMKAMHKKYKKHKKDRMNESRDETDN